MCMLCQGANFTRPVLLEKMGPFILLELFPYECVNDHIHAESNPR